MARSLAPRSAWPRQTTFKRAGTYRGVSRNVNDNAPPATRIWQSMIHGTSGATIFRGAVKPLVDFGRGRRII
jgi:hypothetical protein